MIVFVDNEHEKAYENPWGEKIMAARTRIKYRLEDMAHQPCLIVRYNRVSPDLLRDLGATAVFISGNSASAHDYSDEEQEGLRAVIRAQTWPMFGFCGGFQVMAETYGSPLEPIGPLEDGEEALGEAATFAPGLKHELGYFPIRVTKDHPLLAGLGSAPVMRHAHSWEIKQPPAGFSVYAETDLTPVQMIVHDEHPIVGTQFHPEYYTAEHPDGGTLIRNFIHWAGIAT